MIGKYLGGGVPLMCCPYLQCCESKGENLAEQPALSGETGSPCSLYLRGCFGMLPLNVLLQGQTRLWVSCLAAGRTWLLLFPPSPHSEWPLCF